jgi:hypothetical protein
MQLRRLLPLLVVLAGAIIGTSGLFDSHWYRAAIGAALLVLGLVSAAVIDARGRQTTRRS